MANEQTLKEFRKLMTKSEKQEKLRANAEYVVMRRGKNGYKRSTKIQIFQILEKARFHSEAEAWSRDLIGKNLFEIVSQTFKVSMSSVTDLDLQSNIYYMDIKRNYDLSLCDSLSKYDFVHNLHPDKCPKERLFWMNQIAPDVLESLHKSEYEPPEIRMKNYSGTEENFTFDEDNLLDCPNYQKMKKKHMMKSLDDKFKLQMASALKAKKSYDEALFWLETNKNDREKSESIPVLSLKMGIFWRLGDTKKFVLTADLWIATATEELEVDGILGLFGREESFMPYFPNDFETPALFYAELADALKKVRRYRDAHLYYVLLQNTIEELNAKEESYFVHTKHSVNYMYNILETSVKAKDSELVKRALNQIPSEILTASEPEVMKLRLKNLDMTLEDAEIKMLMTLLNHPDVEKANEQYLVNKKKYCGKRMGVTALEMMIRPLNSPDILKAYGQYMETATMYFEIVRFCILRAHNLELFLDTRNTMQEWLDMAFHFTHKLMLSCMELSSKCYILMMNSTFVTSLITFHNYLHFNCYYYDHCPQIYKNMDVLIRVLDNAALIVNDVNEIIRNFRQRPKVIKFYKENWSILNHEHKRQITMLRNSYLINDHFQIKFAE